MDVLIPALIAVFLSEIGSKTQGFARNLAHVGVGSSALPALMLASLVSFAIAAVGGFYVGQVIAFEARNLLFGVALLAGGLPMLFTLPVPPVAPVPGSFPATLFGFARTQFGDSAQFIVFALSAKTGGATPALAALGALFGLFAAVGIANLSGTSWPKGGHLRGVRAVCGALLSVAGFLVAIRALGLVASA